MAAGSNTETKNVTFWFDGCPSTWIQNDLNTIANVTYWVDGTPFVFVYPPENASSFMPFFWVV